MSIPLTINGATFEYPVDFDETWGINATGWAQAVTNGMLQRAGGSFPLLADVDFGASFGLISSYFTSRASNAATSGTIRLAPADPGIAFRNNAHSGNLILTTDASDNLLYNGHIISPSSAGTVTSITGTANQVIASASTGNVTLSLPQSIATVSSPTFTNTTLSGGLVLDDTEGTPKTVTLSAPTTLSTNWALKFPVNAGSNGQVLSTDGSGVTSWINAAGGGTVNSGTAGQLAYYATSSATISGNSHLTFNSTGGVTQLTATDTSAAELLFVGNSLTTELVADVSGNFVLKDVDNAINFISYNRSSGQVTIPSIINAVTSTEPAAFGQVQYGFQTATQFLNVDTLSTSSATFVATNVSAIIAPTSASNRVKITISGFVDATNAQGYITILRGGGNIALNNNGFAEASVSGIVPVSFTYIDSPATTTGLSYAVGVRKQSGAGNFVWNPAGGTAVIILEELR